MSNDEFNNDSTEKYIRPREAMVALLNGKTLKDEYGRMFCLDEECVVRTWKDGEKE